MPFQITVYMYSICNVLFCITFCNSIQNITKFEYKVKMYCTQNMFDIWNFKEDTLLFTFWQRVVVMKWWACVKWNVDMREKIYWKCIFCQTNAIGPSYYT